MLLKFDLRSAGLVRERICLTAGARPLVAAAREIFVDWPEVDEIVVSRGVTVIGVFTRAACLETRAGRMARVSAYRTARPGELQRDV